MKKSTISLLAGLSFLAFVAGPASALRINEIRIDDGGTDNDEYFEIQGNAGQSLDGLTYVVIGDGASPTCGYIEEAISLTGFSLDGSGLIEFHDDDTGTGSLCENPTNGVTTELNFENSDNVTHLLVRGFTGSVGDKIDTNDDGVLDVTPWSEVIDGVGLDEGTVPNCSGDEYLYLIASTNEPGGISAVGPDGSFVPGHVYRCLGGWTIGPFSPECVVDSPGYPNPCPTGVEKSTWGSLKGTYNN